MKDEKATTATATLRKHKDNCLFLSLILVFIVEERLLQLSLDFHLYLRCKCDLPPTHFVCLHVYVCVCASPAVIFHLISLLFMVSHTLCPLTGGCEE